MRRLAPSGATKVTHPVERERAKTVSLGTNYGISPYWIATALGMPFPEARELLQAHRQAYPVFWSWISRMVDSAMLTAASLRRWAGECTLWASRTRGLC
jgi:DNA polymerase I-like protein with 3'-5' exonuclease and polymerase domains